MEGTVVRLVRERGFGFIRDMSGNEYFFHRSAIVDGGHQFDRLKEGRSLVEFEIDKHSPKGPRATDVSIMAV